MADNPFSGFAQGWARGQAMKDKRDAAEARAENARRDDERSAAGQAALEKYRASQLELGKKRAEIQERNLDLTMAQRLTQVLTDQNMHPEARAFVLDEIITGAGYDPKSERYQGLKKVLLKMPVDQATGLTDAISEALPNSPPGSIRKIVDGLMKGNVSPGDIPKLVSSMMEGQARSEIMGGTPQSGVEGSPQDGMPAIAGTVFEPGTGAPPQEPTDNTPKTPQEARAMAQRLGAANDLEGMRTMLQLARDMEGPAKPYESTEAKQVAERDFKLLGDLDNDMNVVRKTEASMQALDTAIEGGRFTPGSFSSIRQNISQIAEFVGLNPEDPLMKSLLGTGDPATAETIHAASNRIALDIADKLSKMTNMSLAFVNDSVPNLARTPAGNKLIMKMIRAGNARTMEAHAMAEDFLAKHGTLRPPGKRSFQQEMQRLIEKPLFDEEFIKEVKEESRRGAAVNITGGVEAIAEGMPPAAGDREVVKSMDGKRTFEVVGKDGGRTTVKTSQGVFPFITTSEELDKLPPGKPFVWGPNGKLLWKTK